MLAEALREPLLLLLIGTTAFYLAIGDWHEGALLAVLTVVDLGIVVYQDLKTERVLESLRDLASPRALVIRDGVQRRIPGREVVPGDIVIVSDGDRVPADAELLRARTEGGRIPSDRRIGAGSQSGSRGDCEPASTPRR